MESLQVSIKDKGYPIYIGKDLLKKDLINKGNNKWMIITDNHVYSLYGKELKTLFNSNRVYEYVVKPGENSKTPEVLLKIISELIEKGFTRGDKIIALGGGVIGDLAGFCSSIYMRGISFVQVPTTLLAQVDSSVGGKTGVNLPQAKNIIGSFHQPELVLADTSILKTLPKREVISGVGEIIKYGIIEDYNFFTYIVQHLDNIMALNEKILPYVVKRCCEIKANIVSQDEKEKGIRKHLNFGHTIGHAIETASAYEGYTHGEAVIIGMFYESKLAHHMGLIDSNYHEEIKNCLKLTGVHLGIRHLDEKELFEIMGRDKKNKNGKISLILPVGKGEVREFMFSLEDLKKELSFIMEG